MFCKILNAMPLVMSGGAFRGVSNGDAAPVHTIGTSREVKVRPTPLVLFAAVTYKTPGQPCALPDKDKRDLLDSTKVWATTINGWIFVSKYISGVHG